MTLILDGKKASNELMLRIKDSNRQGHIAFILIGDHPASLSYVSIKERICKEANIQSTVIRLPLDVSEQGLLEQIDKLNADKNIDAILVQLPLPKHLNLEKVIQKIDPNKDVDCFHPYNLGRITLGYTDGFIPCTPLGIMELVKFYNLDVFQKKVCILGRSNIVGRPLSILTSLKNTWDATVTLCHSGTSNLLEHTKNADVVITAMGHPLFLKKEHVRDGAIVIDVGINRVENRLVGDVDFLDLQHKTSAITPVPGGVGPMTVYGLIQNTLKAHKQNRITQ